MKKTSLLQSHGFWRPLRFALLAHSLTLCAMSFAVGAAPQLPSKATGPAANPKTAKPVGPCCEIISIDAATGVVTAKVKSTGQSFQFKVGEKALLNSLKVGQGVFTNFQTQQVSVDGIKPCGQITSGPGPQSQMPIAKTPTQREDNKSASPEQSELPSGTSGATQACCGITGIDATKNVASATEKRTGRSFQFKASSPAAMRSLKVGESIYANFRSMQVSLDGKTVFGTILRLGQPGISVAGKQIPGVNIAQLPHAAFGPPQMIPATKAPVANRQAGGPRPYTRYSATGGYTLVHLHGLAGIKSATGVPQGVKDFLYLHARTLAQGQVDNYIVNTQLAEKWFQDHPEPDFVKQAAAQSSSGCSDNRCNAFAMDCAVALVQYGACETNRYAQDVLNAARNEWNQITGQAAQLLGQAQACFQDQTLPVANGAVAFSVPLQFPLSFPASGSTKYSSGIFSGDISGNASFDLPLDANFAAQLKMFYIPCLPFAIRPASIEADGTLGLSAALTASLKATGQFNQTLRIPPTGGVKIPVEVFPITIDGVPIAEMDVSIYLEGSVNVTGNGSLDGALNLQAHEETAFNFSCNGGGCNGQAHRVSVPDTATESVQVQGRIQLKPAVYGALQLDLDWDLLSARAGPEPYLIGEIYGCAAASGSQSTSGGSTSQEFHALTADVDWGIDLRGEVLAGDQLLWHSNWPPIKAREHLLFKPLAPSNALIPAIAGTTQAPLGQPAAFKVKMPTCFPYTDQMEYHVQWTGGASSTGFAAASNTSSSPNIPRQGLLEAVAVSGTQGISFSPPASCTLQSGQADCLSDPLKDLPFDLTWPTAGSYNLTVIPVRDKHGRIFDSSTASQITISVQQSGTASSPSSQ